MPVEKWVPRQVKGRLSAVVLVACVAACSTAQHIPPHYSQQSLQGSYAMKSTNKAYVKFAGGPQIGSGNLHFDGRGHFTGNENYFGEPEKLNGTYQINPDGSGSAQVTARNSDGQITQGEMTLQFESPGGA